jgi:hypothetical protein
MSETPTVVTYWAISLWNSRTFRTNAVLILVDAAALLALPEVIARVPPQYLILYGLAVKALNIYLRSITQRPAVLIAPGTTVAVDVPKLSPPAPPATTD